MRPAFDAAQANNAALLPRVNSVLDYYGGVQRGDNLAGNPHLDAIIERSNRDITTGVDSRFSSAGRYGSGAHAGVLARALGDNASNLRFQNYGLERQYQDNAGRAILGGAGVASALPQAAGSTYADQVRALLGQYNTQTGTGTTTQSQSPLGVLGGIFGPILAGWATGGGK